MYDGVDFRVRKTNLFYRYRKEGKLHVKFAEFEKSNVTKSALPANFAAQLAKAVNILRMKTS